MERLKRKGQNVTVQGGSGSQRSPLATLECNRHTHTYVYTQETEYKQSCVCMVSVGLGDLKVHACIGRGQ